MDEMKIIRDAITNILKRCQNKYVWDDPSTEDIDYIEEQALSCLPVFEHQDNRNKKISSFINNLLNPKGE